jgi:hypothetical protein
MTTLLALDVAEKTGWCLWKPKDGFVGGTWNCKARSTRKRDPEHKLSRTMHLYNHLDEIYRQQFRLGDAISVVAWEEVTFSRFRLAYASFCRLEGVIHLFCAQHNLKYLTVGTTQLKRFAGKGNLDKDGMRLSAESRWPGVVYQDDNEVDARWVAAYALNELGL